MPLLVVLFVVHARSQDDEPHRPQFHFSPPAHWMNDPNGMVYANGEYHLFYQYYPAATVWGPMHWGHAVSKDLLHWQHLPVALAPDKLGYIFSGSAVFDENNTSGFGDGKHAPLVAMFTYHDPIGEKAGRHDFQYQGLAYSLDNGRTWTKYDKNPVIPNSEKLHDFRDTKVFWHEPTKSWRVVFAIGDQVRFYSSPDLKNWRLESEFGKTFGSHGGVWECPDLFPLKIAGTKQTKWVLLVSLNPGGPNGGSATQYFVGDFDGKTFKSDNPPATVMWLDYGRDNYAGVTWSNAPQGRRIFLGWMSNWDYAQAVPTEKWRSAMTLPRELRLAKTVQGLRLQQLPVAQAANLRGPKLLDKRRLIVNTEQVLSEISSPLNEIDLEIDLSKTTATDFGLELSNTQGEVYKIGFNVAGNAFYSDRLAAGKHAFAEKFAVARHSAPRLSTAKTLTIRLFFDTASVELFADNGATALTDIYFPAGDFSKYKLYGNGGKVFLTRAKAWKLLSIWR